MVPRINHNINYTSTQRNNIKNGFNCVSRGIFVDNRIIIAVGEHIVAQLALPGGGMRIRIVKPANRRVIKSGLQIVEPGLGIVELTVGAKSVHFERPANHGTGRFHSFGKLLCFNSFQIQTRNIE